VLSDTVRWITFHSGYASSPAPPWRAQPVLTAGSQIYFSYDFGYLLKLVTCRELPATESEFFDILLTYFPTIYDMKYLQKFVGGPQGLHGGLQKLADALDVERIGPQHQAGSDSLLTANTFFKMRNVYFSGQNSGTDAPLQLDKYANVLYGLGIDGKALDEEGNAAD
jgi:CCR4-NOT transcription complex subunit 7/8